MNLRTLTFTIFLLLLVAIGTALAQTELEIEAAPSHTATTTYRLRFGTNATERIATSAISTNRIHELTNGPWGILWVDAVTVVTNAPPFTGETNSPPSNAVLVTNRPAAPIRLRIGPSASALRIEGTTDGNAWVHLATVTRDGAPAIIRSASDVLQLRTVQFPPRP